MHARRGSRDRERMDRRGVSMVLVAIMIFVLMGMAGIAIDYARLYAFKTQLQTAADAAAMAGAVQLVKGPVSNTTVYGSATTIGGQNLVEQQAANLSPKCIEWNISTGQRVFPDPLDCTDSRVNAVRVEADYVAQYSLSRIFGAQNVTLPAYAIAAVGSVGTSTCLKPWAVPYQNILTILGQNPNNISYNLTNADVNNLRNSQTTIAFKISQQGDSALNTATGTYFPGNYYAVRYPPLRDANGGTRGGTLGNPLSGGNVYSNNISGNCTAGLVQVGDWLEVENGNMVGPTRQGVAALCGQTGNDFDCNPPIHVQIPIWAGSTQSGLAEVQVKYIGAFALTGYHQGSVYGYLEAINLPAGGFSGTPGPVTKAILVQ